MALVGLDRRTDRMDATAPADAMEMTGRTVDPESITVTYDPKAKPFLTTIRVPNPGGPSPVFNEEPVAPLW